MTPLNNDAVSTVLGAAREPLAMTVARLFFAADEATEWESRHYGAVCLVKDLAVQMCLVVLVDLDSKSEVFSQEITKGTTYTVSSPNFHWFPGETCAVGLQFDDEREAEVFAHAVGATVCSDPQDNSSSLSVTETRERTQAVCVAYAVVPLISPAAVDNEVQSRPLPALPTHRKLPSESVGAVAAAASGPDPIYEQLEAVHTEATPAAHAQRDPKLGGDGEPGSAGSCSTSKAGRRLSFFEKLKAKPAQVVSKQRASTVADISAPVGRQRASTVADISAPVGRQRASTVTDISAPVGRQRASTVADISAPVGRQRASTVADISAPIGRQRALTVADISAPVRVQASSKPEAGRHLIDLPVPKGFVVRPRSFSEAPESKKEKRKPKGKKTWFGRRMTLSKFDITGPAHFEHLNQPGAEPSSAR